MTRSQYVRAIRARDDGLRLPRVLPPVAVRGLGAHDDWYGPVRLRDAGLIAEVERAGLAGRGGAAYPAGRKLRSVRDRAGLRGAVLIANGMESEPASAKDAALLARTPQLVLDGIDLAAEAVRAREAAICVRRRAQAEVLADAVAERARAGRGVVAIEVVLVPERYVASAESSLVRYLNGGPALPGFGPPRPFERGVRSRPTLVSNVETLANVALIARHGARWYRSVGTPDAPGSALVTVSGAVRRPGVHEIALGTPLRDVLALGDVTDSGPAAVLAGGYFGTWLPAGRPLEVAASPAALRGAGASFGAGIFLVLPAGGCGLAETARVVRYLAGQSAGQCGPCRNGLPEMAAALEFVAFTGGGGTGRAVRRLRELCGLVEERGACHLPDGVAKLVGSALRVFAGDLHSHERGGPCPGARGGRSLLGPALSTRRA